MPSPEYFRLLKGEPVRKSSAVWENPLASENLIKMVDSGKIVGQYTMFDKDCIYFKVEKVE